VARNCARSNCDASSVAALQISRQHPSDCQKAMGKDDPMKLPVNSRQQHIMLQPVICSAFTTQLLADLHAALQMLHWC
jgi:hypothetical protein